jgi:hypothetical protein
MITELTLKSFGQKVDELRTRLEEACLDSGSYASVDVTSRMFVRWLRFNDARARLDQKWGLNVWESVDRIVDILHAEDIDTAAFIEEVRFLSFVIGPRGFELYNNGGSPIMAKSA